jgi:hypothetical protein
LAEAATLKSKAALFNPPSPAICSQLRRLTASGRFRYGEWAVLMHATPTRGTEFAVHRAAQHWRLVVSRKTNFPTASSLGLKQQEVMSPQPFCRTTSGDPLFNHVSSPASKTAKFNSAW